MATASASAIMAVAAPPPSPQLPASPRHRAGGDATTAAAVLTPWQRVATQHSTAATCAAVLEIALFHPFDTAAKRLMAHTGRVAADATWRVRVSHVREVLFREHASASAWRKLAYLYPGSCYAVVYKILQRVYKFAGQPVVRDQLDVWWPRPHGGGSSHHGGGSGVDARAARAVVECSGSACGAVKPSRPRDRVLTDAVAGCLIGAGEVVLLPFDRLKVLSQTNEHALRRGLLPLLRREGVRGMYAGTAVTICRNVPGSFCLFGGAAFTRAYVLHVRDRRRATVLENLCASTVGALLSITVTNPMDVIKTRVQRQTVEHAAAACAAGTGTVPARARALDTAARMLRDEGVRAYFKGLTPKLLATAPKLVFAYTMTECIYNATNRRLRAHLPHSATAAT